MESFEIVEELDFHLKRLSYDDDIAVAVFHQYASYTHLTKGTNIYCFSHFEATQNYELKILMTKNFTFASELNRFIQNAVEGGLIKKWLMNEEVIHKFDQTDPYFIPLTLKYLEGCLYIVVGMYSVIFFVAIAEQICYRKAKQPNVKKFWIYAEHLISPEKLFLRDCLVEPE